MHVYGSCMHGCFSPLSLVLIVAFWSLPAHIIAALVCSVLFFSIESDFQQGDGNGKVKLLEK